VQATPVQLGFWGLFASAHQNASLSCILVLCWLLLLLLLQVACESEWAVDHGAARGVAVCAAGDAGHPPE
jgi:hypothetical protein